MKPISFVSLPVAEFREKVLEFGQDCEALSKWVMLFSKTLALNGKNEPKDDFAVKLLEQVDSFRKDKAEKMRQLREKRQMPQEEIVDEKIPEIVTSIPDKKDPKSEYGEFKNVKLTQSEVDKLVERLGNDGFTRVVSVLSNYKASSGKKYKSDYAAINNWVIERVEADNKKNVGNMSQASRLLMQIGGASK